MPSTARLDDPRRDDDEPDDIPIRRATRRPARWTARRVALVVTAAVVGVAALAMLAVALTSRSAPLADLQGQTWTHKDLTAFLNAKGLKVEEKPRSRKSVGYSSTRYPPGRELDWDPSRTGREMYGEVGSFRYDSSLEASEDAKRAAAEGRIAFAWGRFRFSVFPEGPSGLLEDIRRALRAEFVTGGEG